MSLIERAVSRLGEQPAKTPAPGTAPAHREAAVDKLTDRIGVSDVIAPVVDAPPIVSPATSPVRPAPAAPAAQPIRIHLEAMRARGMITPDGEQTQIAQEFRVIKRPLISNAFGKGAAAVRNGRRVMVTSAFPGEGKSFCAINLAMSIAAERDHKVLLIDADVARPSIPRELGISTERGLMDWLVDGGPDVSQLVLHTQVEKLSILPAGRRHTHATELLASASMNQLFAQLSERFSDHLLIIDSPPLLVTTEARVLATYMGQIVMVVEANRTPRDAVKEALSTIETSEVIGLVLNKAREADAGGAYYGYGGYGYGAE
jgi:receptor protein-tyrosine kinase